MDCLQAREIMSEAFDRGVAEVPQADEAREHCRQCAECATFAAGLTSLQRSPGPKAPDQLVETILERARKIAEIAKSEGAGAATGSPAGAEAADAPGAAGSWTPDAAVAPRREPHDKWWWGWRIAGGLTAAAVVLFALAIAFQGFRSIGARGGESASAPAILGGVPGANGPAASAPATTSADTAGRAGAARYVSYNGQAFVLLGVRDPNAGSLNSAGALTSSLDTSDTPKQYGVWQSKDDLDLIFVQPSPDATGYLAFRRVVRTLGGRQFALSAEGRPTGYDQWPTLPSTFTTPTASDGSPTFVAAGKDDSGLTAYAPQGASPDAGFAIAPATDVTDPAAGNPYWTWWVPKH